jgi:hypothetical protein
VPEEIGDNAMKKSKVDREKLFQIFCVYVLALVASVVAGESVSSAKRVSSNDRSAAHALQAPGVSADATSDQSEM